MATRTAKLQFESLADFLSRWKQEIEQGSVFIDYASAPSDLAPEFKLDIGLPLGMRLWRGPDKGKKYDKEVDGKLHKVFITCLPRVDQSVRLDNRVIDLRTAANQGILRIQSMVCSLFRKPPAATAAATAASTGGGVSDVSCCRAVARAGGVAQLVRQLRTGSERTQQSAAVALGLVAGGSACVADCGLG